MKSILNYLCLACLLAAAGCNDAFMDRFPRHSVTQEDFFKTVEDLKTYTNGFYAYLDIRLDDGVCDNVSVYGGSRSDLSQMIYGGQRRSMGLVRHSERQLLPDLCLGSGRP